MTMTDEMSIRGAAWEYFSARKFGTTVTFRIYAKHTYGKTYTDRQAILTLGDLAREGFLRRIKTADGTFSSIFALSSHNNLSEEARRQRHCIIAEAARNYHARLEAPRESRGQYSHDGDQYDYDLGHQQTSDDDHEDDGVPLSDILKRLDAES